MAIITLAMYPGTLLHVTCIIHKDPTKNYFHKGAEFYIYLTRDLKKECYLKFHSIPLTV